ncbi:response regulator transcription factor [Ramlibacter sp. HM2]|uniref:Response regulator transcription factor n=2 Tax=Ramlibacter pallidus TaxID=2780087 RepID=A0ABR9S3S7_9BURK|nr:response regulator transcription factor [Ramlibacter pallidus]
MRSLLIDLFSSTGRFQVMGTASTEAEANLWVEDFPDRWDVAIIDLVLAEGTGMNVIARAKRANPKGRVVVLSGFVSPAVDQHCRDMGAEEVFDKAYTDAFVRWLDGLEDLSPEGGAPRA